MIDMDLYLRPTTFIDTENALVIDFAKTRTANSKTDREKVVDLYYAVRDEILYSPYHLVMDPDEISASKTIERGVGYCIEKSLVLAAVGRIHGIPSRLGFSIVQNHLSTEKFVRMLRSDKFVFHGYNEFYLNGAWVKCTPAFNKSLCEKFNTQPLEFDGKHDSIFQQFSSDGKKYMEYLHEYGQFDDLPYQLFYDELEKYYSHLFEENVATFKLKEETE